MKCDGSVRPRFLRPIHQRRQMRCAALVAKKPKTKKHFRSRGKPMLWRDKQPEAGKGQKLGK
jgi:hypothetical protein